MGFDIAAANLHKKNDVQYHKCHTLKISLQLNGSGMNGFRGFCFPSEVIEV